MTVPDLLRTIVAATERITELRRGREPLRTLEQRAARRSPRGELFERELGRRDRVNIIAECKRRSPSRGVLAADYDPVRIASLYEAAGVAAISVVTEPTFFDGALEHLAAIRDHVSTPLLRKDFIVDEYQILEARANGADAVLLIVGALAQADLVRLQSFAWEQRLATLVEVHDGEELDRAIDSGARVIGVNNRNLRTLAVDVEASFALAAKMPAAVVSVSESGLRSRADLERLATAGYRAFLIGERFMTDPDPVKAIGELTGRAGRVSGTGGAGAAGNATQSPRSSRSLPAAGPFIKVCGMTRVEDALAAAEAGATAVGFVFWPKSPRYVEPARAAEIVAALPAGTQAVGVFVDEPADRIRAIAGQVGVSAVQLHGSERATEMRDLGVPVIRATRVDQFAAQAEEWPAAMLLLDAIDPATRGGTGETIDWNAAARAASLRRIVLAGGLTPDNVRSAIAAVRPFGVDVSSGVETSPGVKDGDRVRRFVRNARAAFTELEEVSQGVTRRAARSDEAPRGNRTGNR